MPKISQSSETEVNNLRFDPTVTALTIGRHLSTSIMKHWSKNIFEDNKSR